MAEGKLIDLLVVGAGPTGIAIGAEAKREGLDVLLVDRGPLTANLLDFPTFMGFFTTRDKLEIADIPFAIPQDKPDRRQAVAYYHAVVRRYAIPLALHEEVQQITRVGEHFEVLGTLDGEPIRRAARTVALATGYFHNPRKLGVPGDDRNWVHYRYREPFQHYGEKVVVIGGGNSAVETALELFRAGAHVTLVHRGPSIKPSVKYWLKPDFENRVEDGDIEPCFGSVVESFGEGTVQVRIGGEARVIAANAAYVLVGYEPDTALERRCGVVVDPVTLVPEFDRETCESNITGLYLAGTIQAGRRTDQIFIENSREHGSIIVQDVCRRISKRTV